ncbi:methyltransferase domain-containing protein [bacterium]|nr:methyltransferase domain-containing protein [bacterium]MBU1599736.1 methyltransferase domain-containing protein [bacterium]
MDKKDIATRFSKYAKFYDSFSDIQRSACLGLINEMGVEPQDILEIGCGTGFYTKLLKERFPLAKIVSIDISAEMVKMAKKKVEKSLFFVADGEGLGIKKRFSLITGSSCFQWFFNLRETLFQYKNILKSKGEILFTIFGKDTFQELREVVGMPAFLISKDDLTEIMKELNGSLREERIIEEHPSIFFLLEKIKYSGEGMRLRNGLWTKGAIENLEKAYKSRFERIVATYQIFFCKIKV